MHECYYFARLLHILLCPFLVSLKTKILVFLSFFFLWVVSRRRRGWCFKNPDHTVYGTATHLKTVVHMCMPSRESGELNSLVSVCAIKRAHSNAQWKRSLEDGKDSTTQLLKTKKWGQMWRCLMNTCCSKWKKSYLGDWKKEEEEKESEGRRERRKMESWSKVDTWWK